MVSLRVPFELVLTNLISELVKMLGNNLEMDESRRRGEKWSGVGNFTLWASSMMDRITAQGMERVFAPSLPTSMNQEEWDAMKLEVYNLIRLNLYDEVLVEVLNMTSLITLWTYLEERHRHMTFSARRNNKIKLWFDVMKEGSDLTEHIKYYSRLIDESIAHNDEIMEDEDRAFFLLHSLPPLMNKFVQSMTFGKDRLTFGDVFSSLMRIAARQSSGGMEEVSDASTLIVEEMGKLTHKEEDVKVSGGRSATIVRSKTQTRRGDRSHLECWFCNKKGHV